MVGTSVGSGGGSSVGVGYGVEIDCLTHLSGATTINYGHRRFVRFQEFRPTKPDLAVAGFLEILDFEYVEFLFSVQFDRLSTFR